MIIGLSFFVPGLPKTKGSWRPLISKTTRKVVLIPSKQDKDWQKLVSTHARTTVASTQDHETCYPQPAPCAMRLKFYLPRPQNHCGTGRNAGVFKETAPARHVTKPDLDKLERSILDALTGIVYVDDAQVDRVEKIKTYADNQEPGVWIEIEFGAQEAAA